MIKKKRNSSTFEDDEIFFAFHQKSGSNLASVQQLLVCVCDA